MSPCFEDLFDLPEDLREVLLPYLPKFRHLLLDLSQSDHYPQLANAIKEHSRPRLFKDWGRPRPLRRAIADRIALIYLQSTQRTARGRA